MPALLFVILLLWLALLPGAQAVTLHVTLPTGAKVPIVSAMALTTELSLTGQLRENTAGFAVPLTTDDSSVGLICPLSQLTLCLQQLPPALRGQLPDIKAVRHLLGQRGAMALLLLPESYAPSSSSPPADQVQLTGVIVYQHQQIAFELSSILGASVYRLPLKSQPLLTLWHELGHLEVTRLQGQILPRQLSLYQHEALADLFAAWRSLSLCSDASLAWQQLHRRNLALINDRDNISHWSGPVLHLLLQRGDIAHLAQLDSFADLLHELQLVSRRQPLTAGKMWEQGLPSQPVLDEYNNLVQRLFGSGMMQTLPGYLYWRRPALGQYLAPTFTALIGTHKATTLLQGHRLISSASEPDIR
ncbi:hypothetical protein NFHSH190041_30150 [Shewanella sp. NFH-SH190041]|uniref:hypothetical protein n=1 Tax=Shewanella sp. NFH-SH190041 TaxID=2950245 RepID=UPI0021C34B25|nr:hypothetical protein [Shewanella sp. NFH-SH190041]BDM65563.1 hypothetical protein NFHSH190041_30150 [Shewanella sp. NFH-SH190041]